MSTQHWLLQSRCLFFPLPRALWWKRFIGSGICAENGLQRMMGRFYETVINPYLIDRKGLSQSQFVELMTANRQSSGPGPTPTPLQTQDRNQAATQPAEGLRKFADFNWWLGRANWTIDGSRLQSLSVVNFMSRLGSSDFAKQLPKPSAVLPDPVMADIEQRYQHYSEEASAHFEKRARLLSVLSAFGLAAALYVNPLQIWNVYSTDHETTLKVISLMDTAAKDAIVPNAADQAAALNQDAKKILLDAKQKLITEVASLTTAGAPLGWKEGKFWCFVPLADAGICEKYPHADRFADVFAVLFGGLLIGLGAPFWHDLFKSISGLRDLLSPPSAKQAVRVQLAMESAPGHSDAHNAFIIAKSAAEAKSQ